MNSYIILNYFNSYIGKTSILNSVHLPSIKYARYSLLLCQSDNSLHNVTKFVKIQIINI